eukprot:TRINITY_DN109348_c0_g1_i1.p1 TRINITY_DN109348_c0_g1~~TRINITY_DN109348_c0_g1_i1.p1  ORF type:complete len:153 (+),score=27.30 TRINITY_DN109348_c0_g1_i1:88-546(+)
MATSHGIPNSYYSCQMQKRRRVSVEDLQEDLSRLSLSGHMEENEEELERLIDTLTLCTACPAPESRESEGQGSLTGPGQVLHCGAAQDQPRQRRRFRLEPKPPCTQVAYAGLTVESDVLPYSSRPDTRPFHKRYRDICLEEEATLPAWRPAL